MPMTCGDWTIATYVDGRPLDRRYLEDVDFFQATAEALCTALDHKAEGNVLVALREITPFGTEPFACATVTPSGVRLYPDMVLP